MSKEERKMKVHGNTSKRRKFNGEKKNTKLARKTNSKWRKNEVQKAAVNRRPGHYPADPPQTALDPLIWNCSS